MRKTVVTTEEYPPFHLLEERDGIWQVVDCEPGSVNKYTLAFFATHEQFQKMSETELLSAKDTAELLDFHALSFNV